KFKMMPVAPFKRVRRVSALASRMAGDPSGSAPSPTGLRFALVFGIALAPFEPCRHRAAPIHRLSADHRVRRSESLGAPTGECRRKTENVGRNVLTQFFRSAPLRRRYPSP